MMPKIKVSKNEWWPVYQLGSWGDCLLRKAQPVKPLIRAYTQMAIIVLVSLVGLSLFGCQDRFRYECQDPDNWHRAAAKEFNEVQYLIDAAYEEAMKGTP